MRIITLRCPSCGTVVAGNVLEDRREVKCPGLDCKEVLRFSDLEEADPSTFWRTGSSTE